MCGTAAEITPIRSVDGRPVGAGKPGPVTRRIQDLFFGLFDGTTPDTHGWLEPLDGVGTGARRHDAFRLSFRTTWRIRYRERSAAANVSVATTPCASPGRTRTSSRTARTGGARSTGRCRRPANARHGCRDSRVRTGARRPRRSGPGRSRRPPPRRRSSRTTTSPVCVYLTALPIRLPSATETAASGASTTRPRSPSMRSSSGLPPSCARWASSSCSATLADVGGAVAALVARQQQQGADQVGALLLGALDAQQAAAGLLVQVRAATAAVRPRPGSPPAACAVRG